MKFPEIAVLASAACMAGTTLFATVPYANDFARRTSGPVQTGRWLVQRYQTGSFAANYMPPSGVPGEQVPYDNSAEVQDNWAKVTQSGTVANVIRMDRITGLQDYRIAGLRDCRIRGY